MKNKVFKKCIFAVLSVFICTTAGASVDVDNNKTNNFTPIRNLKVDLTARTGYQRGFLDGHSLDEYSGFQGNILYLCASGEISDGLRFNYKHRLNKTSKTSRFEAIDYLRLCYRPHNSSFEFGAGKEAIFVGGIEYDYSPVDGYFTGEFYNHFPCYAWAVHASWQPSEKNEIDVQITESPYKYVIKDDSHVRTNDLYGYNLIWYGKTRYYNSIWSVGAHEYDRGDFIGIIALGNQFKLGGGVTLNLDWTQRSALDKLQWSCFYASSELRWRPEIKSRRSKVGFYAKFVHDYNYNDESLDLCASYGTSMSVAGGGFECFPLANDDLRLHAYYGRKFGKTLLYDTADIGALSILNFGITWTLRILR